MILSTSRFKMSDHVKMKPSARILLQESLSIQQLGSTVKTFVTVHDSKLSGRKSSSGALISLSFMQNCSVAVAVKAIKTIAFLEPRHKKIHAVPGGQSGLFRGAEKSHFQNDFTTSFRVRFLWRVQILPCALCKRE